MMLKGKLLSGSVIKEENNMKSTVYSVWFEFEKDCPFCGCHKYVKDGALQRTVVQLQFHGWPVCDGCKNHLPIKTECEVNE